MKKLILIIILKQLYSVNINDKNINNNVKMQNYFNRINQFQLEKLKEYNYSLKLYKFHLCFLIIVTTILNFTIIPLIVKVYAIKWEIIIPYFSIMFLLPGLYINYVLHNNKKFKALKEFQLYLNFYILYTVIIYIIIYITIELVLYFDNYKDEKIKTLEKKIENLTTEIDFNKKNYQEYYNLYRNKENALCSSYNINIDLMTQIKELTKKINEQNKSLDNKSKIIIS